MGISDSETGLQELLDHHAILQLLNRYARALDERDYDLLDQCFTPDAELDFSDAGGGILSYPQARRWLQQALGPLPEMQHCITNVETSITGSEATSRCYTVNINGLHAEGGLRHIVVGAAYLDRLVRTPAGWRICQRRQKRLCAVDTAVLPTPIQQPPGA